MSTDSASAKPDADSEKPSLEQVILDSLEDDKAENIVVIDLGGKSSIADSMIIASGRSARHVSALADHVIRKLKEKGFGRADVEGKESADWVLIDAGDVVVHIFRPEVRDFYQLERIWTGESAHMAGANA